MCQSRAQGGKRCAAHNNSKEFNRAKRALKAAVAHRDQVATAWDDGDTTVTEDLISAEHDVLVAVHTAAILDPKITDERLDELWADASPEVREAAMPVAKSAIAHGKKAAKLSGEAHTARMFDRDDEAEAFEQEADAERSKVSRLVDALVANAVRTKYAVSEALADAAERTDQKAEAKERAKSETSTESKNTEPGALRGFLIDLLEGVDGAISETAEGMASAVGIASPTVAAPTTSANTNAAAVGDDETPETEPTDAPTDGTETADDTDATEQTDGDEEQDGERDQDGYVPDPADDPAQDQDADENTDSAAAAITDDTAAPAKSADKDAENRRSDGHGQRAKNNAAARVKDTETNRSHGGRRRQPQDGTNKNASAAVDGTAAPSTNTAATVASGSAFGSPELDGMAEYATVVPADGLDGLLERLRNGSINASDLSDDQLDELLAHLSG